LTNHPAYYPAFSPDGKQIAFVSDREGPPDRYHLYVMNADGTGVVKLTHDFVAEYKPAWSPNGHFLAFVRRFGGQTEIYRINADGTNPINLTNHPDVDVNPTWSPDGTQIAFFSTREGGGIYMMNADGTGVVRLTPPGGPGQAAWYGLAWYGPRNLAVTPHPKWLTTWGWIKGLGETR
jgi:Tol biopolymer transport system component